MWGSVNKTCSNLGLRFIYLTWFSPSSFICRICLLFIYKDRWLENLRAWNFLHVTDSPFRRSLHEFFFFFLLYTSINRSHDWNIHSHVIDPIYKLYYCVFIINYEIVYFHNFLSLYKGIRCFFLFINQSTLLLFVNFPCVSVSIN